MYSHFISLSHSLAGRRKQIKEMVKVDLIILVQIIDLSHLSFIVYISSVYRTY